jgi:hypothetical protein
VGKWNRELCAMPPPMDTVQVRAACSMQGQALLAATSFGLELNSDDRIKIICMRSET